LALPAVEVGPVVGHYQTNVAHAAPATGTIATQVDKEDCSVVKAFMAEVSILGALLRLRCRRRIQRIADNFYLEPGLVVVFESEHGRPTPEQSKSKRGFDPWLTCLFLKD
jgi:hypothetical protein